MKFVVRIILIVALSSAAISPALAKDGGKPPEPKQRVEIVREPKSDSRGRSGESSRDTKNRDGNSDNDRSRGDRDKPKWVENS
jgi:hypothetical protein